ncbi:hypothetical protein [Bacillus badius]|uniref:Secreted protein n=1 Tax=Bacillus badius TaxID=1455 RepID=A0ABR5AXD7_BACBA|nr:hypothetical protein [Bacillus badius]KIL76058.1 hypothetical protein SD78_0160 [Bacillus badius]KIL79378.1 hypothetical protein SD77_3244 [Bacillus badius]MED4716559.1 hypothetical protein [Bacillus badius]
MMKKNAKAKWIVGMSGIAFSAFILGQLDDFQAEGHDTNTLAVEANDTMSQREKELLKLDWSSFSVQAANEGNGESDRMSRKSKRD